MFVRCGGRRFRGCMRRQYCLRRAGLGAVGATEEDAVDGGLGIVDGWSYVTVRSRLAELGLIALDFLAVAAAAAAVALAPAL